MRLEAPRGRGRSLVAVERATSGSVRGHDPFERPDATGAFQDWALADSPQFEAFLSNLAARLLDAAPEDLDRAIQASLSDLLALLRSERGGIALFSEDGLSLTVKYGSGAPASPGAACEKDLARSLPWYVREIRAGRPVIVRRAPEDLPPAAVAERAAMAAMGLKSTIALPLKAGGEVLGVLGADHDAASCSWPPRLVSRLELLARLYAGALHRRRDWERLERAAGLNRSARSALETSLREVRELKEHLEAENVVLQEEVRRAQGFDEIVGTSPPLGRLLTQVEQVAPTDAPVLLLGETGTGKDLVARALHGRSRRRDRPLVIVNCAALPSTLIESELFGYEKGAFTGALQRAIGRFEVAHGGSLLLDEIGEMPVEVQAKLLRVLQTGEFERLGSSKTIKVDVRLIAATNRDLEREVREGRFRPDLYYRLSVFPITLPPLRDRREDVPLLVWHFIARRQAALGRSVKRVPERLMRAFGAYSWPGNVRELENVVERALIMTTGTTLAADAAFLEAAPRLQAAGSRANLADTERAHIRAVLDECGWKVAGKGNAADRLGLKRSTLQFRMRKLGITRPPVR